MSRFLRAIATPAAFLLLATVLHAAPPPRPASPQKKDYLSDAEADKIRDAGTTGPRIVLFMKFAQDRIKKIQYELAHIDPAERHRADRLNSLLNGYIGCVDDATDLLDLGVEKQEDIREGIKTMQARLKEFLPYLQQLSANGPERETYKDNLDDAIEGTQDAIKEVEMDMKEMSPPPVRRKQS
ncbi:MAG TPA: hypothetical protein VNI36_02630 [Candidatus Dormibacteraeota bacterium]|nr:hypothetical protein [Candidatus Dormibacteraeota bacterium]